MAVVAADAFRSSFRSQRVGAAVASVDLAAADLVVVVVAAEGSVASEAAAVSGAAAQEGLGEQWLK